MFPRRFEHGWKHQPLAISSWQLLAFSQNCLSYAFRAKGQRLNAKRLLNPLSLKPGRFFERVDTVSPFFDRSQYEVDLIEDCGQSLGIDLWLGRDIKQTR